MVKFGLIYSGKGDERLEEKNSPLSSNVSKTRAGDEVIGTPAVFYNQPGSWISDADFIFKYA